MRIDIALDNLLQVLEESNIYQNYKHILDQVKKNKDINEIVKNIKKLQKMIVNEAHQGNDIHTLESKLELENASLNGIPLYQDYIASCSELNNLVNIVNNKLQAYLDDLDI